MLHDIKDLKGWDEDRIRRSFGGKAFGLYQASMLDLPIPKTWLIEDQLYESFLDEVGGITQLEFLPKAARFIQEKIGKELASFGRGPFAVRSSSQYEDSSKHSYAGIFESKLDILQNKLPEAIAEVWWSCHSVRAQHYLLDSSAPMRMAVLVQPMIRSKYAGVAFSRHPSPVSLWQNHDAVIEFAPASGEEVVQGRIIPMRLTGKIGDLALQKGLPWLEKILNTLLELKQYTHHEVDIEFVIDPHDTFWLVQQRPVSRLHASKTLDLSGYSCKYKRSLCSLDVEMLIDGCSRFLSSYLELPIRLDTWLVMTTSARGQQELWANDLLDRASIDHIIHLIQEDPDFLERIRERYRAHFQSILEHDYTKYIDPKRSLYERFCAWSEFFSPLTAHYYAPMFLIEALHDLLLHEMIAIDVEKAEKDLFKLGTEGIRSLMDLLYEELRKFSSGDSFSRLQPQLEELSERFGFLNCRVPYDKGFSAQELYEMLKALPEKSSSANHEIKPLKDKYITSAASQNHLIHLKEWMRVRNQEMEYLMFAMQKSQPLFAKMAEYLHSTPKELWNSSREIIASSLKKAKGKILQQLDVSHLVIARYNGRTHVLSDIEIQVPTASHGELKGQTVYGQGHLTCKVVVAFSPEELSSLPHFQSPYVLVTGMTTPDFLPHLKGRFSSLITDEGGILCHAAIVAREISLPCIVGTRLATEQLKSGDEVEIDFNRGEIKLVR